MPVTAHQATKPTSATTTPPARPPSTLNVFFMMVGSGYERARDLDRSTSRSPPRLILSFTGQVRTGGWGSMSVTGSARHAVLIVDDDPTFLNTFAREFARRD